MSQEDIIDAWAEIRKTNNTIPDDVLNYMKNSALSSIKNDENNYKHEITINVVGHSASGKSTVIFLIKELLKHKGFHVNHTDLDYGSSEKFDNIMSRNISGGIDHITSKTKIKLVETNAKININK